MMNRRVDRSKRVVVEHPRLPWEPAQSPGIEQRMLEWASLGDSGVTAIVRHAPGARRAPISQELEEEFFVLQGDLNDENGRYESGTYVRQLTGSASAPWSDSGCVLFRKTYGTSTRDAERAIVNSNQATWWEGAVPGLSVMPLAEFGIEHTALVRWDPGTVFVPHRHFGGEEILVLDGTFEDDHGKYPAGTWIRSPHLSEHYPFSVSGCTIWVKTGHLSPEQVD